LEYNGIKYDVKFANPTLPNKKKRQTIWEFDLRKGISYRTKGKECDFYICIGMLNGIPKRTFLIPIDQSPKSHIRISITGESKYHKHTI
jgi:hypothetical protein